MAIAQHDKKKRVLEELAENAALNFQQKFASLLAKKHKTSFLEQVRREGVLLSGQPLTELERKYA